jgi:hypothetical protein
LASRATAAGVATDSTRQHRGVRDS